MGVFDTGSINASARFTKIGGDMSEQIADKDYYRDAEHNLVEADDPKAAFLVVGKGSPVSKEIANRYGIGSGEESAAEPEGEAKADKGPAENKSASKSTKGAKNK